jgi:hypothetical protein
MILARRVGVLSFLVIAILGGVGAQSALSAPASAAPSTDPLCVAVTVHWGNPPPLVVVCV